MVACHVSKVVSPVLSKRWISFGFFGGLLQYSISLCISLLLPCLAALGCRKCSLRTGALHVVSLWTTSANGIQSSFWFSGVYLALPSCALEASPTYIVKKLSRTYQGYTDSETLQLETIGTLTLNILKTDSSPNLEDIYHGNPRVPPKAPPKGLIRGWWWLRIPY